MNSLRKLWNKINRSINVREDAIKSIYLKIDSFERAIESLNDEKNDIDEDIFEMFLVGTDNISKERLSHLCSLLYTEVEKLESEQASLYNDLDNILYTNNRFMLNYHLPYEELELFMNKYIGEIDFNDLKDIFIIVKQKKQQEIIREAEEEIEGKKNLGPDILDEIREQEGIIEPLLEELAGVLDEENEIKELDTFSNTREKIMYFIDLVFCNRFVKQDNETAMEYDNRKQKFLEEKYSLIDNVLKMSRSFQQSDLYKILNETGNLKIYEFYKETNDLDSLTKWLTKIVSDYQGEYSFQIIDEIINNIKKCNSFLRDYMDLTGLETKEDIENNMVFLDTLNDFELLNSFSFSYSKQKEQGKILMPQRKNIVVYTPDALESGLSQELFDEFKKFVNYAESSTWEEMYRTYRPNLGNNFRVASDSYRDFSPSKYKSIAKEFELHKTIRILGSRDAINSSNKERLMKYFNASEMEIISIHNIFESDHGGKGLNQAIGQYGYTPYYKQLTFYNIFTKGDVWTDEEFHYICEVINSCNHITNIVKAQSKKDIPKNIVEDLINALNSKDEILGRGDGYA